MYHYDTLDRIARFGTLSIEDLTHLSTCTEQDFQDYLSISTKPSFLNKLFTHLWAIFFFSSIVYIITTLTHSVSLPKLLLALGEIWFVLLFTGLLYVIFDLSTQHIRDLFLPLQDSEQCKRALSIIDDLNSPIANQFQNNVLAQNRQFTKIDLNALLFLQKYLQDEHDTIYCKKLHKLI